MKSYFIEGAKKLENMDTCNLNKSDWNRLNKLGLVSGEGNGFANTTDKFDKEVPCSSFRSTYIKIEGMQYTYIVKYVSGCFYPIWQKAFVEANDSTYYINKHGIIS